MKITHILGALVVFSLICAIMASEIRGAWWQWLLVSGVLIIATALASEETG